MTLLGERLGAIFRVVCFECLLLVCFFFCFFCFFSFFMCFIFVFVLDSVSLVGIVIVLAGELTDSYTDFWMRLIMLPGFWG